MSTSRDELSSLLQKAQSNRIDLTSTDIFSENLITLINAHADAIGVPPEFILWPLLTAAAAFIGTNGQIMVNSEWKEPAIIWFVIAARKGEKKTAALRRIRKPIEKIEENLRRDWCVCTAADKPGFPPQLIIDHFSFEELHTVMLRNRCQLLGMFDELSCFYGQLDLYKHSSTVDRKTLLTLNGGGPWGRNFKSYSANMESTAFNVTGFIQPSYVHDMLTNAPDADGLNDRQLFDFPPERELFLEELKVPMSSDVADLQAIFIELMEQHQEGRVYTLEDEAYREYQKVHDILVRQKLQTPNEKAQGILSKARGYTARIAMVLHALEQAIERISCTSESHAWSEAVASRAVKAAGIIMQHFNAQKFILLGLSEDGSSDSNSATIPHRVAKILSMETKGGDGVILPSEVSQKHISERVGSSYPTSKALELLDGAVQLGYGELEEHETSTRRRIRRFRKRRLSDLSSDCKEALKKACISDELYNKAFLAEVHTATTLEE